MCINVRKSMFQKMTKNEEILTILGEECAEVIVEISKCKRFGLAENKERLLKELADLQCMIDLTKKYVYADYPEDSFNMKILQKYDKLRLFSDIFKEPLKTEEFPMSEHQKNSIEWFGSPNGA